MAGLTEILEKRVRFSQNGSLVQLLPDRPRLSLAALQFDFVPHLFKAVEEVLPRSSHLWDAKVILHGTECNVGRLKLISGLPKLHISDTLECTYMDANYVLRRTTE